MNNCIAYALIIGGAVLGIWLGVYYMLIGGVVQVFAAYQAPELIPYDIAYGFTRILFSGAVGWITALLFVVPGISMIKVGK